MRGMKFGVSLLNFGGVNDRKIARVAKSTITDTLDIVSIWSGFEWGGGWGRVAIPIHQYDRLFIL